MKQIILYLFVFSSIAFCQEPDSLQRPAKVVFNWKTAPWYGRAMPFGIYTGQDKFRDKVAQYVEFGKSFDMLDIGVAVGRNALRPDSTLFTQLKVTMDVANFGVFANEMTIGAGVLFRPKKDALMLELSYNILAQVSRRAAVGITTGFYDFANEDFDLSRSFYGFVFRWGLQRTDAGGIMGRPRFRPSGKAKARMRRRF